VRNVSVEDVMQTLRKSLVIGTKLMRLMPQLKLRNQRPLSFDATSAIATDLLENLSLRVNLESHAIATELPENLSLRVKLGSLAERRNLAT